MSTLKSRRRNRSAKRRGRWDNSPAGIRRRNALADAKREAAAALLPPVPDDPEPLSVWQTVLVLDAYGKVMHSMVFRVPMPGLRCDQFAGEVDGERVLLTPTEAGKRLSKMIAKRPSVALQAEMRSLAWQT